MGGDSWLTDTNRPVRPPQGVHLPFKATQRRACMAAGQSPCSLHQGRCGDFLHKGGGDAAVVGCVCVCVRCPGNRVEVTGRRTRNVFTSQRIHDRQKRGQSSAPLLPPPLQGSRALTHLRDSRAMDRNDSRAWLSGEQLIYAITVPLSTAIILANLVIILGIAWNRQLHNTPNYLFLSLLVADLCTAVALPFIPLMGLNRELSSGSCLVAHFFPNFLFLAFLFNLVMVHYERYTCIVDPLRYSDLWMHRSFPLALLAVWAPPLLYASLPAFGWNNWTGADRDGQNATAPSSCSYRRVFPNAFIYLEVYGLVLPAILAIAGMTGRVLWITRGQLKDICRLHRSLERGGQASEREHRLNLRYVRCVVAVTMTFLACWVPQLIYMHVCIAFLVSDTRWSSTTHIVLSCTGVGSVAVVPLVLGLANRQYTEPAYTLLQKLRDRWCKGRRRRGGQSEEIVGNV